MCNTISYSIYGKIDGILSPHTSHVIYNIISSSANNLLYEYSSSISIALIEENNCHILLFNSSFYNLPDTLVANFNSYHDETKILKSIEFISKLANNYIFVTMTKNHQQNKSCVFAQNKTMNEFNDFMDKNYKKSINPIL